MGDYKDLNLVSKNMMIVVKVPMSGIKILYFIQCNLEFDADDSGLLELGEIGMMGNSCSYCKWLHSNPRIRGSV